MTDEMKTPAQRLYLRKRLSVIKTFHELFRAICAGFCVAAIVKLLLINTLVLEGALTVVCIFIFLFGVLTILFSMSTAKYEHELEQ